MGTKIESPVPLLTATKQIIHIEKEDGPSSTRVESQSPQSPQSPRRSSKQRASPKSSRHSSSSSRMSARPIRELPQLNLRDIEKEAAHYASSQRRHDSVVDQLCTYDSKEEKAIVEEHALQLLIFLAGPVFLVSLANSFFTMTTLILFPFLFIFSLCHPARNFRELLMQILAPLLRWQLELIYATAPLSSHPKHHDSLSFYEHNNAHMSPRRSATYDNTESEPVTAVLSLTMLILVQLFSPFISMGVVLSTWVAAFFWFYAGIIGNPEGTGAEQRTSVRYSSGEKPGEHDGRASVIGVRAWWKGWLTRAVEYRTEENK